MTDQNVVKIHGKDYMTVAGRVIEARKGTLYLNVNTEVLAHEPLVVVKATVTVRRVADLPEETYTGISGANPSKTIEKQSPYEVAETSAVGRALGFAGFGSVDSIASADEMKKAGVGQPSSENRECTCGTTGLYHAFHCPARKETA